uniref:C-type lectin domain-containing protein n=1 Tax=Hippocampus comes TaxID=109280 RepID=A0A3Q2YSV6_HIPCM
MRGLTCSSSTGKLWTSLQLRGVRWLIILRFVAPTYRKCQNGTHVLRCSGPDWYEFGEFCYKPFEDKKTWADAQDTCRSLGAELVSIRSMVEQSWLESYLYFATSDMWTGLNDLLVSGMYVWSDHHMVTFTYWAPGEPNNHHGFNDDCVKMLHQVR